MVIVVILDASSHPFVDVTSSHGPAKDGTTSSRCSMIATPAKSPPTTATTSSATPPSAMPSSTGFSNTLTLHPQTGLDEEAPRLDEDRLQRLDFNPEPHPPSAPMDLRSSKVIGMARNLRSASRSRWSVSREWAQLVPATPMQGRRRGRRPPARLRVDGLVRVGAAGLRLGAGEDASWHSPGSVQRRECGAAPSGAGPSESHSRALL